MGVTVLAGTDVDPIGSTLHFELELLADAGMAPIDVLRAATIHAAESVGAGAELGALEVGRVADIVLLDANPLEDIANTERIWRVVKDGVVHRPGDLRPSPN
jgi:imidazolonepropionase-like amidohydrolase